MNPSNLKDLCNLTLMKAVEGKRYEDKEFADYLIKQELSKKKVVELRAEFNREVSATEQVNFSERDNPVVISQMPYVDYFITDIMPVEPGTYVEDFESFKKAIVSQIKDKNFFDLGCGDAKELTKYLAEILAGYGATKYVGVDARPSNEYYQSLERPQGGVMDVYVLKDEMLNFLRTLPDGYGGNFLCSGLEERGYDDRLKNYLLKLFNELHRVTKIGDVVIISGPSLEIIKGNCLFKQQTEIKDESGTILFILLPIVGGLKTNGTTIYKRV